MDFLKLVMGSTEIEAAPPLSTGASLLIRTVVVDSAGAACALFWLAVLDQRNIGDEPQGFRGGAHAARGGGPPGAVMRD
jgi:hypothetical protein